MSAYNPDIDLMEISLGSIANQTWKNIEIFIVDDASDRSAQTAIKELAATYDHVKVIRIDVNSGPYFGRNLALLQAKGEFIAFQDADDWSHPQRIAAQLDYLLRTPEARVVATEHMRINRAGRVSLEGQFKTFGHGPATSVFRAEIFDQIGGFAAIRSRGDVEMHERVAAYYGCQANALLPFPMALCFADSGTLSHQTAARRAQHLHLFRTNRSSRIAMHSLFRDGVPLRSAHQTPVPMMLRAPEDFAAQLTS
jgi:glycosyltransferase involved in cell wall biosynthesis